MELESPPRIEGIPRSVQFMPTALVIVGALCLLMAGLVQMDWLGQNAMFGLRTRATMRSSAAWAIAHRAVKGEVTLIGVGCILAALIDHLLADEKPLGVVALLVAVALLIHAGIRGDSAARKSLPTDRP